MSSLASALLLLQGRNKGAAGALPSSQGFRDALLEIDIFKSLGLYIHQAKHWLSQYPFQM